MDVYLLFHKCATQWIRAVFSELETGRDFVFKGRDPSPELPPGAVGMWENLDVADERFAFLVDPARARTATILRDPRDILISAYNSHKKTHPVVKEWVGFEDQRERLNRVPFDEGLVSTMDFLSVFFRQLNSVVKSGVRIFLFDEVISRPEEVVRGLLETWGIAAPNIPDVLAKYSFQNLRSGKVRTGEFPAGHYRKGIAGEWRAVLSDDVIREFRTRHGELLDNYDALQEARASRGV